jgi:hypothetical protein
MRLFLGRPAGLRVLGGNNALLSSFVSLESLISGSADA